MRSKKITLGLYCDPDCNIITCEDTGGGIRPDLIDRIYERGVSSKGENRGTGLFLEQTTCRRIARGYLHRNRRRRRNLLYHYIYRKGETIMYHVFIIEDDPMVASINKQYIEVSTNFRVEHLFKNGAEALPYIKTNPVDLVILDYLCASHERR